MCDTSINALKKDKKKAQQRGDFKEVANLCNVLGNEYQENGLLEEALSEHDEELRLLTVYKDKTGIGVAHRRLGEVYSEMGEWNKALEHQKRYLKIAKEMSDIIQVQRAYTTLGRTYYQYAETLSLESQHNKEDQLTALKESENASLLALSVCDKLSDKVDVVELSKMRCRVYHNLGLVLDMKDETSKAITFVQQEVQLCLQYNLLDDANRAYSELSKMHLRLGSLETSLTEAKKSLTYAQKLQKKNLIVDSYDLLARNYLTNNDCISAKKCYYKAWKLKHSVKEIHENIEIRLKTTVNICMLSDFLSKPDVRLSEDNLISNYEKLGDAYSKIGFYDKAIEYYKKTLEKALAIGKDEKYIASIYASLGQTYADNNTFLEALNYYKKELDIQSHINLKEAIVTLTEVAKLLENNQGCFPANENSADYYQRAHDVAKKSVNPKLRMHVIKCQLMSLTISEDFKKELKKQLQNLVDVYALDTEEELSNEEESDSDVDLTLLDFSDSDEEFQEKTTKRRRKNTNFPMKRTNTGDTPLHVAAIKGKVQVVKRLLELKHSVNVRDNSGWLPLHEACNFGHLEIVELLINAGSNINDSGGKECMGITPLHDAAMNGHLKVVSLLLKRGASVLMRDDKGKTPLDNLIHYTRNTDLTKEELKECQNMQKIFLECMERAGVQVSASVRTMCEEGKSTKALDTSNEVMNVISNAFHEDSDESENNFPTPNLKPPKNMSTKEVYINAVRSVGSHSKKCDENSLSSSSTRETPQESLIPEETYVQDDWLIDDLGVMPKNRFRINNEFDYKEKCLLRRSPCHRKRKPKQQKISNFITFSEKEGSKQDRPTTKTDQAGSNEVIHNPPSPVFTSRSSPLRLHVKVFNKKLLIPVSTAAQAYTIGWLQEDVSRRYMEQYGVKVKLRLLTSKEAELNPSDLIGLAISSQDSELHSVVEEVLDMPSLPNRYSQACYKLGLTEYIDLVSILRDTQSSSVLDLSCSFIRNAKDFNPIQQAIQYQNLQVIKLDSCRIDDCNFKQLLQSIVSMPLLQMLEARTCSLTTESLEALSEIIENEPNAMKSLTVLNLSYNYFAGAKFSYIKSLLSLPSLKVLSLQSCDLELTGYTAPIDVKTSLETFQLDYNEISVGCLANILSSSPRLSHLSLSESLSKTNGRGRISLSSSPVLGSSSNELFLGSVLNKFIGIHIHSPLHHLDLSKCALMNEDLSIFVSCVSRCMSLNLLNLSYNTLLSEASILKLLHEMLKYPNIPLQNLYLHGIESISNSEDFCVALCRLIERKYVTVHPLVSLSFADLLKSSLTEQKWREIYSEKAEIVRRFGQIYLRLL